MERNHPSDVIKYNSSMSDYQTLRDLCQRATWGVKESQGLARWNDIERWLGENWGRLDMLKNDANEQQMEWKCGNMPLHFILRANPPFPLVEKILRLAPDATKMQNKAGYLPLHIALMCCASSPEVTTRMIFDAYPEASRVKTRNGSLPLHLACENAASPDIIKILLDEFPKATEIQDDKGHLPLHIALFRKASHLVIDHILDEFPQATKIADNEGRLPLHIALCHEANSVAFGKILNAYPRATEVKDEKGCLPFIYALHHGASPTVIKLLLDLYPKAAELHGGKGKLPLHIALQHEASPYIIKMILDAYPKAVEIHDDEGHLPIYYACSLRGSLLCTSTEQRLKALCTALKRIDMVLLTFPESIALSDRSGKSPSDLLERTIFLSECKPLLLLQKVIYDGLSTHVVRLILKAFPESCKRRDKNRMVPLHYACSTNAPHFLDYIMALIDANHTESFTFKDNLGRTPLQLLTFKASSPDEKKRLPLHYLAATPNGLSEQSMKILVDAYPESLSSADKYDLLPFHYACLNQDSSLEVLMLFIYLSAELCIPKPCKSI